MTKKKIFFVLAIFIILLTSLFIEKDIINKILYPKKYSDYVETYPGSSIRFSDRQQTKHDCLLHQPPSSAP